RGRADAAAARARVAGRRAARLGRSARRRGGGRAAAGRGAARGPLPGGGVICVAGAPGGGYIRAQRAKEVRMGLFSPRRPNLPALRPGAANSIPVSQVDLGKRYDVYCADAGYDRLYEDVRFVGIRTFDRVTEHTPGLIGGFLELEAADGSRCLIPSFGIRLICEHGTRPAFKVLR